MNEFFMNEFVHSFIVLFFLSSRDVNSTEAYLKLETLL